MNWSESIVLAGKEKVQKEFGCEIVNFGVVLDRNYGYSSSLEMNDVSSEVSGG